MVAIFVNILIYPSKDSERPTTKGASAAKKETLTKIS